MLQFQEEEVAHIAEEVPCHPHVAKGTDREGGRTPKDLGGLSGEIQGQPTPT